MVVSSACTGRVFINELRITNAVRKNLLPFFNMFFIFFFLSFRLLQQKRRDFSRQSIYSIVIYHILTELSFHCSKGSVRNRQYYDHFDSQAALNNLLFRHYQCTSLHSYSTLLLTLLQT